MRVAIYPTTHSSKPETVSSSVEGEDQDLRMSPDLYTHALACIHQHSHRNMYVHTKTTTKAVVLLIFTM